MTKRTRILLILVVGAVVLCLAAPGRASGWSVGSAGKFDEARIYIEYNSSGNDLGFHVSLDAVNWKELAIYSPKGRLIFEVEGGGPYRTLGMTELFFEGAEPSLDDVPLRTLLGMMPEGKYRFVGLTTGGARLESKAKLSHAVPAGPEVSADVFPGMIVIHWEPVEDPPEGFPDREIEIAGYQVIVEDFQVTLPESATSVTLPLEFVESLEPGEHDFEVLAIDESGNQTITEGTFTTQ